MELQYFKETITSQVAHITDNVYDIMECLVDIDTDERKDRDASTSENFESFLGHITNDLGEASKVVSQIYKFVINPSPIGEDDVLGDEPVVSRLNFLTGVLTEEALGTLHNLIEVADAFDCHWESINRENNNDTTYNASLEDILDILGETLRVSESILSYVNKPQTEKCIPKSCGLSSKGGR